MNKYPMSDRGVRGAVDWEELWLQAEREVKATIGPEPERYVSKTSQWSHQKKRSSKWREWSERAYDLTLKEFRSALENTFGTWHLHLSIRDRIWNFVAQTVNVHEHERFATIYNMTAQLVLFIQNRPVD